MTEPSPGTPGGGRAPASLQPGQSWAYRARQVDELVQVTVVRLGTQRPARVLVGFVDEVFEGRQEWVPPARLEVLWQDVAGYRAREERWDKIYAAGLPPSMTPEKTPQKPYSTCCSGARRSRSVTGSAGRFTSPTRRLWRPSWAWTPGS